MSGTPNDTLTLIVNGQQLTGWQQIRVTRSVERVPADFDVLATELYPYQPSQIFAMPGARCRVLLGSDVVLTGYVDRYSPSIDKAGHGVRVVGRSKCEDVVDCSADIHGAQMSGTSALDVATRLSAPFGITAQNISAPGPSIEQFNVILGETVYEIVERVCRYAALLCYDDENGNLVLATNGALQMASGFAEGVNIQEATVTFSMDERFSKYTAVLISVDNLADLGESGNVQGIVYDPGVLRYRPRIIVCEQFVNGVSIAKARAQWECNRRYGRSQQVTFTCDSWRDSAGKLWQPNARAPLNIPSCKLVNRTWAISEVSYLRDQDGTRAEITMMPAIALQPEPSSLNPFDWQVAEAVSAGGGGAANPSGPAPSAGP